MKDALEFVEKNVVDQKYADYLKHLYPNHDIKKLLLLNFDLRILYLKYLFVIEACIKNILINHIFFEEVRELETKHFINKELLKKLKEAQRIIRQGYAKYFRNGILKSKTISSLIEVMSFENLTKLLATLNDKSLNDIAEKFGLKEFHNPEILLEQLDYLKDTRNYLAHNYKVLGVAFSQKRNNNNYYQQDLEANNDHHYLHIIINRFASYSKLLPNFYEQYKIVFDQYEVAINKNLVENSND